MNKPANEVKHYHRDGYGRSDGNGGGTHNYHPNSFDEVTQLQDGKAPPYALSGALDRHNHRGDDDAEYGARVERELAKLVAGDPQRVSVAK